MPPPYVVKTDGLAAGKGVLVTDDLAEAEADVRAKLAGDAFGDAGRTVVIEEGMTGPEVSVFALCDGARAVALAPAQDFKRVGDGDTGPNTGGMGAYSPLPWLEPGFADDVIKRFVQPTLDELRRRGIDYRGAALHRADGHRRGPEAGRVQHPLRRPRQPGRAPAAHHRPRRAAARGGHRRARAPSPTFDDGAAVLVVAAAEGYPDRRPHRRPHRGPRRRPRRSTASTCSAPAWPTAPDGQPRHRRRPRARGRRPRPRPAHRPGSRLRRASATSTWPGAHHRTDIAETRCSA